MKIELICTTTDNRTVLITSPDQKDFNEYFSEHRIKDAYTHIIYNDEEYWVKDDGSFKIKLGKNGTNYLKKINDDIIYRLHCIKLDAMLCWLNRITA